ncbi:hypothetical protein [Stenotrophomonas pavanii]|uniref:hypothetical protein n=1 Tax=Stenotrophomonas pavanii TaxID=487698 RepID=UPI0039C64B9E
MSTPVDFPEMRDGDVVGIDTDGCSILWNADAQRGENSGEPPTEYELAVLVKGGAA